jgi:hypothetical protein
MNDKRSCNEALHLALKLMVVKGVTGPLMRLWEGRARAPMETQSPAIE